MRSDRVLYSTVTLALVACGDTASPLSLEAAVVRHFGELRAIMHEGRTGPAVRVGDVVPGPHAYGLGALSELRGEVTVIDDVVWTAYPRDDGTAEVRSDSASDESAALFVVAKVPRWRRVVLEADIASDGLDAAIEQLAMAAGVDTTQPFPVRISGALTELRWHVVDGSKLSPGSSHADHARTAVSGVVPEVTGELVGFFSTQHQGVFTHRGSSTHFHVVVAAARLTGHVDGVGVRRGASVLFPER